MTPHEGDLAAVTAFQGIITMVTWTKQHLHTYVLISMADGIISTSLDHQPYTIRVGMLIHTSPTNAQ